MLKDATGSIWGLEPGMCQDLREPNQGPGVLGILVNLVCGEGRWDDELDVVPSRSTSIAAGASRAVRARLVAAAHEIS